MSFLGKGTYQRDLIADTAQSWTGATEFEVDELSDAVFASGKDEMYSWVRGMVFLYDSDAFWGYEWMVIKCDSADALQDLNNNSAVEDLLKEGRIFARGLHMLPAPSTGAPVRPIKFEFYKVELQDGEELRLVIRPLITCNAGKGYIYGILEWRQVGN